MEHFSGLFILDEMRIESPVSVIMTVALQKALQTLPFGSFKGLEGCWIKSSLVIHQWLQCYWNFHTASAIKSSNRLLVDER
jgi:hypothetical protein